MTTLQRSVAPALRALRTSTPLQAARASLPLHRRHISAVASRTLGKAASASQVQAFSTTPSRHAKELPPRGEKYKKLTKEDIEAFKGITSGVLSTIEGASTASDEDLVAFNEDWMYVKAAASLLYLENDSRRI